MTQIEKIMQKKPFTIGMNASVLMAAKMMVSKGVSCLVIVQNRIVKGIITQRDILEEIIVKERDALKIKVSEIMTTPVKTVSQNADAISTMGIMSLKRIKQIPVTKAKKIVGIVTQTDFVRNIAKIIMDQVNVIYERVSKLEQKLKKK